jgi:hypothetical protein
LFRFHQIIQVESVQAVEVGGLVTKTSLAQQGYQTCSWESNALKGNFGKIKTKLPDCALHVSLTQRYF